MKRRAGALPLLLAGAWALGCSSCPSTALVSADGPPLTLDAAHAHSAHDIVIDAPTQSCGCRWCGDANLSVSVSATLTWASPDPTVEPVVRFTLAPNFATALDVDTLDPALPLDVVLTAAAPSAAPALRATHLCPGSDPCYLGYRLTVARVEPMPVGKIEVHWSAETVYASQDNGTLGLTLSP